MHPTEFRDLVEDINNKRVSLLGERGQEYAKEADQVSSFKELAALCNILKVFKEDVKPSQMGHVLIQLKVMRYHNLIKQGLPPTHPKVMDTLLDLHNYEDLTAACELDEKSGAKVNA